MDRDKVWLGDPRAGFILGRIVEIGNEGPIVQPLDRARGAVQANYDTLYPAEEDERKEVDDNCSLMYLNEATLLHNVKLRYKIHCCSKHSSIRTVYTDMPRTRSTLTWQTS